MIPVCPKCLTNDEVERDGGHGRWFCGRRACFLTFTGDPGEQHHYRDKARKQEAHRAEMARQALDRAGEVA